MYSVYNVPSQSVRDYSDMQRRLLPHAQAGSQWVVQSRARWRHACSRDSDEDADKGNEQEAVLEATDFLGSLCTDEGKLIKAKYMYERALRGRGRHSDPTTCRRQTRSTAQTPSTRTKASWARQSGCTSRCCKGKRRYSIMSMFNGTCMNSHIGARTIDTCFVIQLALKSESFR